MARTLLLIAAVMLLTLALTPAQAKPEVSNATFLDSTGVHAADVVLGGACNGSGTITVTIHRASGDDVRSAEVLSMALPEVCGGGMSCMDCPPVPFPFAWTLESADGSVSLVGGGGAYYDHYSNHVLAWSLQGTFMEGFLEVRGVLS